MISWDESCTGSRMFASTSRVQDVTTWLWFSYEYGLIPWHKFGHCEFLKGFNLPVWAESLVYICILSNLFPLIIGLFYFRHLSLNMRILLSLYLVFLLAEWIVNYQAERDINNLWIFHLITIFEYITLTTVFIFWQKISRTLVRIV